MPQVRRGRPEAHVYHTETEAAGDKAVFRGTKKDEEVPEYVMADIIDFKPKEKDESPPVILKRTEPGVRVCHCKWFSVVVDETTRRVECRNCGAVLDPVQVLLEYAKKYRSMDYKLSQMAEYEKKEAALRERDRIRWEKRDAKREEIRKAKAENEKYRKLAAQVPEGKG